ncbi:MAG: T9SS type A sorting domain-containing protein [Bacteroidaceae bacterium]
MRKSLLLVAGLLLAGFQVSAQQVVKVQSMSDIQPAAYAKLKDAPRMKLSKDLQRNTFANVALATKAGITPSENLWMGYMTAGFFAQFDDLSIPVTITVDEQTKVVTLDGLQLFDGANLVTGTLVDDKTIKIAPQTLIKDAFQTKDGVFDMCLAAVGNDIMDIELTLDEKTGQWTFNSQTGVLVYYAGLPTDFKGIYYAYTEFTLTCTTNLPAYYTTNDLWNYAFDQDGEMKAMQAVVSDKASTIDWTSYLQYFEGYQIGWSLDGSTIGAEGSPYAMPVANATYPICVGVYNDVQTPAYGYPAEAGITVGGTSYDEMTDYGFTTFQPGYGTAAPLNIWNEYLYGQGEQYNSSSKAYTKNVAVISYYPNKGNAFSFSAMDLYLMAAQDATGDLVVSIIKATLSDKGWPQFEDKDIVAQGMASISDLQVWNQYESNKVYFNYGLLPIASFVDVQTGQPLSAVEMDGPFVVVVAGFNNVNAGLFADAVSDYSKSIIGDYESVFLWTEDNALFRTGAYKAPAIFFRGAAVGNAVGIQSVVSGQNGNIKVMSDGESFNVVYPEGMNSVEVINVAGQTVANYSLEGTSASISAAGLNNGMYMLKFNDGTTVKVVK